MSIQKVYQSHTMPEADSTPASSTAATVPHSDDDGSPDHKPPLCQRHAVLLLPHRDPSSPRPSWWSCSPAGSDCHDGVWLGESRSSFPEERSSP